MVHLESRHMEVRVYVEGCRKGECKRDVNTCKREQGQSLHWVTGVIQTDFSQKVLVGRFKVSRQEFQEVIL